MQVRTGTDPLELGTIFETLTFLELKFITYLHEYAIVDCKMQSSLYPIFRWSTTLLFEDSKHQTLKSHLI